MDFKTSSQFHRQMARLLESGLSVTEILSAEMFPQLPGVRLAAQFLASGETLADSLERARSLPLKDILLIRAAEESGKLPVVCKTLSDRYEEKAKALAEIKRKLSYPAFLLVFAAIAIPFPQWLMGKIPVAVLLAKTVGLWIFFAAIGVFGYFSLRNLIFNPRWRDLNRWVMHKVPILGPAIVSWSFEDYFSTMGMMLQAGVTITHATKHTAEIVPSLYLRQHLHSTAAKIEDGKSLSEAYTAVPFLNQEQRLLLRSAEKSGALDESFSRIGMQLREENRVRMEVFSAVFPKLIYFAVMFYIAAQIIQSYVGYFDTIDEMTKGI